MSEQVLHQDIRLSDSLERSIMNTAFSNGEAVSVINISKNALRIVVSKLTTFGKYVVKLSEHMNESRAKSERFARSHW